jgi:hypothetical protein
MSALPVTLPIPLFGRLVLGLGENSSYSAAKRGDIPTMDVGGKKRALVRAGLRRVAGGDPDLAETIGKDLAAKLEKLETTTT